MADKGLVIKFCMILWKISVNCPGAVCVSDTAPLSNTLTGNIRIARTDNIAANNVLTRYNAITTRKREPSPWLARDMEEATKTATKIGAMDFSAPTNNVPSMLMPAMFGTSSAKMVPKIIPPNIRSIRLLLVHS